MRKYLLSLFLLLPISVFCQEATMRDIFKQMPDTIVPYMTSNNRLDFIDFMDSHMNAEITNSFGGKSKMLKLTEKYLLIQLSEASSLEMRLLPINVPIDSLKQIICLVQNYGKDIRDCSIKFYSLKWKLLNSKDYIDYPFKSKMYDAFLDEKETILTLIPGYTFDLPTNEDQKLVKLPSIKLKWEGGFVNYN